VRGEGGDGIGDVPPAENRDEGPSLDAEETGEALARGDPADGVHLDVDPLGGGADGDEHRCGVGPSEGVGAERDVLVGVAAQEGVDDEGLQPRIPRTPPLVGVGVDVRRRERDLARIAQDGLGEGGLLPGRGDVVDLGLDDLEDPADEVEGLRQRDRPCELGGRRTEDDRPQPGALVDALAPPQEGGETGVGHEGHPRAFLGGQRPVPGEGGLEVTVRGGREGADRALQALDGLLAAPRLAHGRHPNPRARPPDRAAVRRSPPAVPAPFPSSPSFVRRL